MIQLSLSPDVFNLVCKGHLRGMATTQKLLRRSLIQLVCGQTTLLAKAENHVRGPLRRFGTDDLRRFGLTGTQSLLHTLLMEEGQEPQPDTEITLFTWTHLLPTQPLVGIETFPTETLGLWPKRLPASARPENIVTPLKDSLPGDLVALGVPFKQVSGLQLLVPDTDVPTQQMTVLRRTPHGVQAHSLLSCDDRLQTRVLAWVSEGADAPTGGFACAHKTASRLRAHMPSPFRSVAYVFNHWILATNPDTPHVLAAGVDTQNIGHPTLTGLSPDIDALIDTLSQKPRCLVATPKPKDKAA